MHAMKSRGFDELLDLVTRCVDFGPAHAADYRNRNGETNSRDARPILNIDAHSRFLRASPLWVECSTIVQAEAASLRRQ
jgi:hypothetical protein